MAVNNLNFGKDIGAWARVSDQRLVAVFRGSTQEAVSRMQARIPIDTGFARSSLRASLEAMPPIDPAAHGKAGEHYSFDYGSIVLTINSAHLGQTIYLGYTANYILPLELGHSKQAPNGFVALTALEWTQIVDAEVVKAKVSVASRA